METTETKPSKLDSVKDFWNRKKGAIAITATATTVGMVALCRAQNKQFEKFLEEKGMKEDFWKFIGATEEEINEFIQNPL